MQPVVVTGRETFRELARTASGAARVPVEARTTVADPFDAYRRAREGEGEGGFFLETGGGRTGWGYFGVAPSERLQVTPDAVAREGGSATLAALGGALEAESLVRGDCDVPYPCGLFGWLSYDVARELESLPGDARDDRELPRSEVGLYDCVAAWTTPVGDDATLRITACPRVTPDADLDDVYDLAVERALALARSAREGDPTVEPPPVDASSARFRSTCGREAFGERVRRAKAYIRDGETFQANVSQRLVAPAAVHPVEAYAALRQVNPAPYAGLLEFPEVDLVSASPELLLERVGDRVVTEPIAGTRPRGSTASADTALEDGLRTDEKERAEHAMLVDLERNDLGKISRYGSVSVPEYRRVDRYSEVMHLVSVVEGRLRPDTELAETIEAVFPGGTVTGAPKPRTLELIDELEATRRGPYTGSLLAIGFDERATLNILIRTLVRHGEEYHLRVGAGVVHDSDPEREYEETLAKGRALVRAIDEALEANADLTVARECDTPSESDGDRGEFRPGAKTAPDPEGSWK